ncbi:MAG: hypothetical protein DRI69_05250 [Bacteroidetes bacterium]|nr:MAG: hypothetical protein DRI69_05250 [Bacteroidota bacterium]
MDTTQYFYRNVIYSKQGNTISIIDIHNPDNERQELEAWFGLVVHLGDGQHSIDQLIEFLSTQYKGSPPGNLEQTIHSVVERLADSKFIVLTKEQTELPYYLSLPYEQLDVEKAMNLLAQDETRLGQEISIE